MRTTTLRSSGPEVGVIGLGCMGMTHSYDMAAPRDDAKSISVIHQALDLGITLIDTADAYGPYTNEELVGRGLAGGRRSRAVLATKVGLITD
jgi:aryl-alcohol dehydrogenase-like predicted oxidoreductase